MKQVSLRRFILPRLLLLAALPILVVELFKIFWIYPRLEIMAGQRLANQTDVLASQIRTHFHSPLVQIEGVAGVSQKILKDKEDWGGFEKILDAQVDAAEGLDVVYAVDHVGRVRALGLPARLESLRLGMQDISLSRNPLWLQASNAGKVVWSEPFLSPVSKGVAVGFAIPFPSGVLLGETGIEGLYGRLNWLENGIESVAMILDQHGQVIFDADGKYSRQQYNLSNLDLILKAIPQNKPIAGKLVIDGREMLGFVRPISGMPWFVLYAQPHARVTEVADKLLQSIQMVLLLVAGLSCFWSVKALRHLSGKFDDLIAHADDVATEKNITAWPEFDIAELSQLSGSLQRMDDALLNRRQQQISMMENLPGVVYRCRNDASWSFDFASDGAIELFCYRPTDLRWHEERGLQSFILPEDLADAVAEISDRLRQHLPWQVVFRIRDAGQAVRWVRNYGHGVVDDKTSEIFLEGFMVDETERVLIRQALIESEESYRTLANSGQALIWTAGIDGLCNYFNQVWLDFTGRKLEDELGNGWTEGVHPDDVSRCFKTYELAFSRNDAFSMDYRLRRHDGVYRWIQDAGCPRYNRAGAFIGYIGYCLDITDRMQIQQELEASEKKLRTIVSNLPMLLCTIDKNGVFTMSDGKALELLSLGPSELVGQSSLEIYRDHPEIMNNILRALKGEYLHVETEVNGIWFENIYEPFSVAGHEGGILITSIDITERKKTEKELRTHKEKLEDLIEQRTLELMLARDAAQRATRAKSEFLANMSHEIRTPINAVIGMAHLAQQTELNERQRDYLHKIDVSSNLLLGLINDILDFSKIEAGKLELAKASFNLADVLDRIATVTCQQLQVKKVEFLLHVSPEVSLDLVGDAVRLGQVLINLCGNAAKFTDSGEIVLSVVRQPGSIEGDTVLRFSVMDTGIGMTAAQQEQLFKPFSQVDCSNTRRYGGTGLGLAICKQLVEMMGGRIWVESQPGQGSEFSFTACFSVDGAAQPEPQVPADLQGLRTLVVDDSLHGRDIVAEILGGFAYPVSMAASMEDAAKVLQDAAEKFDLVLLDEGLLELADVATVESMRQVVDASRTHVIVLFSGAGAVSERRWRADALLHKPVTRSSLFDAIATAWGRAPSIPSHEAGKKAKAEQIQAALSGKRVLLVEDNDFNQQVAQELLQNVGVVVTIANHGREAVDRVREQRFDLVLMDIQMPVMDGYESTRIIRSYPDLQQVPIIAMTAHAMVDDHNQCLAVGMNDFISKPVDPDDLYQKLVKWIRPAAALSETALLPPAVRTDGVLPAVIPGIDMEAGLRYSADKANFYLKMLGKFLKSKADNAVELRAMLEAGDHESAHRSAHTMKSVAGHIGAHALAAAAASLEKTIRPGLSEIDLADLLDTYSMRLDEVIQGLRTALPDTIQPALEVQLPAMNPDVAVLLVEMVELLKNDVGQALQAQPRLHTALESEEVADLLAQFEHHLEMFDTEAAIKDLQLIQSRLDVGQGGGDA